MQYQSDIILCVHAHLPSGFQEQPRSIVLDDSNMKPSTIVLRLKHAHLKLFAPFILQ